MKWRAAIVIIALLYMVAILFGRLPDRLILFPTTHGIASRGAERNEIAFPNGVLEILTARSQSARQKDEPDFYVLRFYGNADRAERWVALEADAWNGRAVELWGVNYPGFGRSTGPAGLRRMADSGLAAFDRLYQNAGGKPIIIFGASIGSTVALHVAANRKVAGLVLHNPTALRPLILRNFGWWNLWLLAGPVAMQIPSELDSIANARRVHAPAVFLLAERDELVAPRFQHLVVDAFAGEQRVIVLPGATHNSALEGAMMPDVYKGYDWLLARQSK